MKFTLIAALLLLVSVNCSSPQKRPVGKVSPDLKSRSPANEDQLPPPIPEDRVLSQWQEERRQNFFDWPVDDARMTRGFLPNRRRPHLGLDLAAPQGTRILASHDGVVIYAGRDFHGFGKMVMVEGAQGWATLYAHLSVIQVKEGDRLRQGELIGKMGRTGRATGVHLHFEVRRKDGPVDPLNYLPGGTSLARQ